MANADSLTPSLAQRDHAFSALDGNGFLLEAAKMLAMVPEWQQKPGKLKQGIAQQCQRIARYLVNAYVKAEDLPSSAKFDLVQQIEPAAQAMRESVEAGRKARGTDSPETVSAYSSPVPASPELDLKPYCDSLNAWHLEMALAVHGLRYVLDQVEFEHDDPLSGVSHIVAGKALELVESCPFPLHHKT